MIPDNYLDLIHREIDGLNSAEEQARLRSYLPEHPEARALYSDLKDMAGVLNKMEPAEPPFGSKAAILAALPAGRYAPAAAPSSTAPSAMQTWIDSIRSVFAPRPGLALAYTFALGTLAGVIGMGVFESSMTGPGEPPSDVVGAMGTQVEARVAGPRQALGADDLSGGYQTFEAGERLIVEVEVDAGEETELLLNYDDGAYSIRGYRLRGEAELPRFDVQPGQATTLLLHRHRFEIELLPGTESENPVEIVLRRGDTILQQAVLEWPE